MADINELLGSSFVRVKVSNVCANVEIPNNEIYAYNAQMSS